ncbi:hypothetical protein TVAG_199740 [Trichomonas vaginalis G3]|uniref:Uncharacterized protein n=1 Tax=Trichomonas vaginalis (strain ATCC PRA-98 / G3) TaxID=412133 RepID=A2FPG5_TRIV3|nr:hypothetical protein TVAGG3_0029570 [Trichomonas vaginalis G3]EAX93200.1 hypothetical protein TVAG_199740 [Trichomonas vaginalis G3]KAI5540033.1 hypothetical protein TVAGG3_0029570 [Trichomonas vaginalis G3]|eukprot:XP_001306130.1 hypothetical protein [Trichomonas vaginalis G3]
MFSSLLLPLTRAVDGCQISVMMASEARHMNITDNYGCLIIQASQWYDFSNEGPGSAIYCYNLDTSIFIKCCYFERCYVPEGSDGAIHVFVKNINFNCVAASDVAAKENQFGTVSVQSKFRMNLKYFSLTQTGLYSSANIGENHNFNYLNGALQWDYSNISHCEVVGASSHFTLQAENAMSVKCCYGLFINGKGTTCVSLTSKKGRKILENINMINLTSSKGVLQLEGSFNFHSIFVGNYQGPFFNIVGKYELKISTLYYLNSAPSHQNIKIDKLEQRNESLVIDDKYMFNRYRWNLN